MSWLRLSREEVDLIARKDKHIRSSRRCLDAFPGEGQSRQHTLLRGEAVPEPTSVFGTGRTFKTAESCRSHWVWREGDVRQEEERQIAEDCHCEEFDTW